MFCHEQDSRMPDSVTARTAASRRQHRIAHGPVRQSSFREHTYEGVRNPYVIIINNVNFYTMPAPRSGAVADFKNVEKFLTEAGFKTIKYYPDVRRDEMLQYFQCAREDDSLGKS